MSQSENHTPITADFTETIDRCAAAYRRVRAELKPKDIGYNADRENNYKAYLAFSAELPILSNPASFQLYVACIAKGVAIGAIDIGDAGRLCHIVQTAMSVWKLANLTIPALQEKQRAAEEKARQSTPSPSKGNHSADHDGRQTPQGDLQPQQEDLQARKNATPLPPNGNHFQDPPDGPVEKALQDALDNLPTLEVQKQHFQSLRNRGILLPSDGELRDQPIPALHFCRMAEEILRQEAPAGIASPTASKPAANS